MSATQELPQCMAALEKANEKRSARAELKRSVAAGRTRIAQILLDPPEILITSTQGGQRTYSVVTVCDVLTWQKGWGMVRARKMVKKCGISPHAEVHHLSDARRAILIHELGV